MHWENHENWIINIVSESFLRQKLFWCDTFTRIIYARPHWSQLTLVLTAFSKLFPERYSSKEFLSISFVHLTMKIDFCVRKFLTRAFVCQYFSYQFLRSFSQIIQLNKPKVPDPKRIHLLFQIDSIIDQQTFQNSSVTFEYFSQPIRSSCTNLFVRFLSWLAWNMSLFIWENWTVVTWILVENKTTDGWQIEMMNFYDLGGRNFDKCSSSP